MIYYVHTCAKCRALLDMYVICSGLGPPRARCGKCNTVYATERMEWTEMSTVNRARFVGVSLIHACTLGFLGGLTGSLGAYGSTHGFTSTVPRTAFFGVSFYVSAACWATLVVMLQILRVRRSEARARARETKPVVSSLTSLDFALQLKLLALVWAPALTGDIIGSTGILSN